MNLLRLIFGARRRHSTKTLHVDPGKQMTCAQVDHGALVLAFTDHDSGRNIIVRMPRQVWPSVARAMGSNLAFLELQRRREGSMAAKVSGNGVRA